MSKHKYTPEELAQFDKWADEAEIGYDVDEILRTGKVGRPLMGSASASVESVRLDPELKLAVVQRASSEGLTTSELIRKALRAYVEAPQ